MTRLAFAAMMASAPLLAVDMAAAQAPATGPETSSQGSNVTVHGPERMVCRNVTRTATRMRSSRVCRRASEVAAEDQRGQDERLADAADRLDMYGEKVSTNDVGGFYSSHETVLGPR